MANVDIKRYLAEFIGNTCLLGNDPITGHPYRSDAQCLCISFNNHLKSIGCVTISSRVFNKEMTDSFGVGKMMLGGRNTLLGIADKSCVMSFIPRRKTTTGSDTERREIKKVHNQVYRERHEVQRVTPILQPILQQPVLQPISQQPIPERAEDDDSDDETEIEAIAVVPEGPPPMVPLNMIGNGLRVRPAVIVNNVINPGWPGFVELVPLPSQAITPVRLRIVAPSKSTIV